MADRASRGAVGPPRNLDELLYGSTQMQPVTRTASPVAGLEVRPQEILPSGMDPYGISPEDKRRQAAEKTLQMPQTRTAEPVAGPEYTPPTIERPEDGGQPTTRPADQPYQTAAGRALEEMFSPEWTRGLQTQMAETTARGIENLRAGVAQQTAAAGLTGQGAGRQAMGAVEEFAIQENARNALNAEIAGQEVKERAVALATQRGYLDIGFRTQAVNETMTEMQSLVNAGGEENFRAAEDLWRGTFGYDIDMSRFQSIQGMQDYFTSAANVSNLINTGKDITDPGITAELQQMWNNSGGSGTMDPKWAENTYKGLAVAGNYFDYTLSQIEGSEYLSQFPGAQEAATFFMIDQWSGAMEGYERINPWEVRSVDGTVLARFDDSASANNWAADQAGLGEYEVVENTKDSTWKVTSPGTGDIWGGYGTYKGGAVSNDPDARTEFTDRMLDLGVTVTGEEAGDYFRDVGNDRKVIEGTTDTQIRAWQDAEDDVSTTIGIMKQDDEYVGDSPDVVQSKMLSALINNSLAEGLEEMDAGARDKKVKEYGFYNYGQFSRAKDAVNVRNTDLNVDVYGTSSRKTAGEKSMTKSGMYSLIAAYNPDIYDVRKNSKEFPNKLVFNPQLGAQLKAAAGTTIEIDPGDGGGSRMFYVDPNNPIDKIDYGTFSDSEIPMTKEGLRVLDSADSQWKTIEWRGRWTWGETMAKAKDRMKTNGFSAYNDSGGFTSSGLEG